MTSPSRAPRSAARTPAGLRRVTSSTQDKAVFDALSRGRQGQVDDPLVAEMAKNRRVNGRRTAATDASGGLTLATGRPVDPMFYWKANNLPYDINKPGELEKIRAYCRILYLTHPIIASAIDVYSKYPLTGMELVCKDEQLTDFYSTLFFDQLGYEDYLIDIGREYWTVGEAWPLGSFNETLGVWEDDELVNPDDVDVIRSPFLKDPRLQMRLPETLRMIIENRAPKWEYEALMRSYPELKNFTGEQARMPVSNVLLKQLKFKGDTFHPRGVPILMRGFRAVMQEEMLNAAQDAVASRLYTPLILAKLGASAGDLGTQSPWIPTAEDMEDFQESLDAAMAGDFRVLIHHFATSMETVFGRENMPNMDADFDRLTDRQLQVFGLSKTMLSGAEAGETYAADAINRDLISQLLTNYQRLIKQFVRGRMLVVAEAQEHYDYEERGGKRYPIMEEVLEVDEETGQQRIVEQPKLLVPELHIKAMTMKDEQAERDFRETLRASGIPISMKSRLVNVPLDLKDEIDRTRQEQIDLAVEAQETRKATYEALRAKGLPIADDLRADFEPKAHGAGGGASEEPASKPSAQVPLQVGMLDPNTQALAPTPEEIANAQGAGLLPETGVPGKAAPPGGNVVPLTRNKALQPDGATRPPESDEMRASMPKPASLVVTNSEGKRVAEVFNPPEYGEDGAITKASSWTEVEVPEEGNQSRLSDPRHLGMRREAAKRLRGTDGELLPLDDASA